MGIDAVTFPPAPENEPVRSYAPGSPERSRLEATLKALQNQAPIDLPARIGDEWLVGGGDKIRAVRPDKHSVRLGTMRNTTHDEAQSAIYAAQAAAPVWRELSLDDRAAIFLKAADLLAGPWRDRLNAATMLGQSKTPFQAEIDSACELIDFWRFNAQFAREVLAEQPLSSAGVWNRLDHRPLEGFVYAITPFNFTSIAGNLPTAPALMGNTVIWKPAPTQQYSANVLMELLIEAGLPPGVINMLPGDGIAVSDVALADRHLAGIHFTGSTGTFQTLWKTIGSNIANYRSYPRVVGETGGKDFVLAHPSADLDVLRTALVRGAFEYQGQKCSAASRAYIPQSVWSRLKSDLVDEVESLKMGESTAFSSFVCALIDERAFDKVASALERAEADPSAEIVAGGQWNKTKGYYVRPAVIVSEEPKSEFFTTEYFGPLLSVFVYDDRDWDKVLDLVDDTAPYALTGAIISQDRGAVKQATERLRYTAGNFYVNDKPTGAVVGQQPFGGSRASGTNDKAGSAQNLLRWTSARAIKETFDPPKDYRYPYMG